MIHSNWLNKLKIMIVFKIFSIYYISSEFNPLWIRKDLFYHFPLHSWFIPYEKYSYIQLIKSRLFNYVVFIFCLLDINFYKRSKCTYSIHTTLYNFMYGSILWSPEKRQKGWKNISILTLISKLHIGQIELVSCILTSQVSDKVTIHILFGNSETNT